MDDWQLSDLPTALQADLLERLARAYSRNDLLDIDAALASADRMTEEVVRVLGFEAQTEE